MPTLNLNRGLRRMSPPTLKKSTAQPQAAASQDLKQAEHQEKDGFSWGEVAIGAGMAAGALLGASGVAHAQPVAEAAVEQVVESPEVVVLSESIQRIDLDRRTEEDCTSDGNGGQICTDENVAYHPVGVHAGQGVVRDLNGNLFVAPQLVAEDAPGVAVVNPDRVDVRGPFGARGRLERESDGDYETSGSLFGYHTIDVGRNSVEVGEKGLFGSSWRVEITNRGSDVKINERYRQDRILESDGELRNTGLFGGVTATIEHSEGRTEVDYPGWFTGSTTVTYNGNSLDRRDNGWLTSRVTESGDEHKVKDGSIISTTLSRTEETKDGWTDKSGGWLGPSYRYRVRGGETVPGGQ